MRISWLTIFFDLPADGFDAGVRFWGAVTGTTLSPARGEHGEFATLVPATGDAYLRTQRLAEGGPRCHLDLHVDDRAGATREAVARGATHLRHDPAGFDSFSSPGGFPFCLVPAEGEQTVPPPADGARLDQLCLDIPPRLWDSELSFWSALTGWEPRLPIRSEFTRLGQPDDLPVKLLLQHLDDDAPAVTAHPDFAAPGRRSLAPVHAAAGARVGRANELWTTMTDPLGLPYCLTGRKI